MADEGRFSLPVRLLLTPTQRGRLFAVCQEKQLDVADVISEIVGTYLDSRDDLVIVPAAVTAPATTQQMMLERQIRRLRMQAKQLGTDAPPWLGSYIAELEQEVNQSRQ